MSHLFWSHGVHDVPCDNKYQKVDTYKHSLQILSGASSFEENLPQVGLTPEKKCKRLRAAFILAGTLRVSACWELVL